MGYLPRIPTVAMARGSPGADRRGDRGADVHRAPGDDPRQELGRGAERRANGT